MFTATTRLLLAAVTLVVLGIRSEIRTVKHIKELPSHIEQFTLLHKDKTLICCWDIDHTAIRSTSHVGSDHWFGDLVKRLVAKGHTFEEAVNQVKPHYYAAHDAITVIPVEPETIEVIKSLQDKHPTIAITKRSPGMETRTREQLTAHDIIFSKTAPHKESFIFNICDDGKFVDGHLLCANNHKHDAFKHFRSKTSIQVDVLVMIDDRRDYLEKFEIFCIEEKIAFLGVHYTHLEDWVKTYDYEQTRQEYIKLTGKQYDF